VLFSKLGRPTSWSFATDLCVELEPLLAAEKGVESLYLDVRLEDSAEEDLYPRCAQPTVQIIEKSIAPPTAENNRPDQTNPN
jgi:hypothetical protein